MTRPRKNPRRKRDLNPGSSALEADVLTTRPTRQLVSAETTQLKTNNTNGISTDITIDNKKLETVYIWKL